MCWKKSLNKNKAGDILVDNIVLAKNLTDKEFVQFVEYNIKKAKTKYKDLPNDQALAKYLQDLAETIKLRRAALSKYLDKFENFFKHFDGEIKVGKFSRRDNTPTLWLEGAHNYLVNGKKIRIGKIRKPPGVRLDDIPNDIPFIANVELKYSNRYLPKKPTSSFFPKNWDNTRVQEEIALVYESIIKSGKDFSKPPFKFTRLNSDKTFEILIEVDRLGNIVNSYPNIKI